MHITVTVATAAARFVVMNTREATSAPLPDSALAAALADLPPRYREALLLKYCNGYSHREIAGFLSTTPEAVSQVIRRAKKRLAKALEEGEDAL